jgi:hypothetical protein
MCVCATLLQLPVGNLKQKYNIAVGLLGHKWNFAHILYVFCRMWIKFSTADDHKNVLSVTFLKINSISESHKDVNESVFTHVLFKCVMFWK